MMSEDEKLGRLIVLERRIQDKSMESKITQFEYVNMEKSRSKINRENSIMKREKLMKICKIKLINASKLISNVIR